MHACDVPIDILPPPPYIPKPSPSPITLHPPNHTVTRVLFTPVPIEPSELGGFRGVDGLGKYQSVQGCESRTSLSVPAPRPLSPPGDRTESRPSRPIIAPIDAAWAFGQTPPVYLCNPLCETGDRPSQYQYCPY